MQCPADLSFPQFTNVHNVNLLSPPPPNRNHHHHARTLDTITHQYAVDLQLCPLLLAEDL
jgi:hypothetical protein